MKRVFICSPYRGNIARNVQYAQSMCQKAAREGYAPIAPHLYIPGFLNDNVLADRERGLLAGLSFLAVCDEMWVCTIDDEVPSVGMQGEIEHAKCLYIPIVNYNNGEPL